MILKVVCAIIVHDKKILAAKRSIHMPHPGYWEFPGGKMENGEDEKTCLHREIKEELNCHIVIEKPLHYFEHKYADKKIVLKPFICSLNGQFPTAVEHEKIRWLTKDELNNVKWLPADIAIKDFLQTLFM